MVSWCKKGECNAQIYPTPELCGFNWANTHNKCAPKLPSLHTDGCPNRGHTSHIFLGKIRDVLGNPKTF